MEGNDEFIITKDKGILTLKLNRLKKKNAMTSDMLKQMIQAMEKAKTDDDVKVIYFTATGEVFLHLVMILITSPFKPLIK